MAYTFLTYLDPLGTQPHCSCLDGHRIASDDQIGPIAHSLADDRLHLVQGSDLIRCNRRQEDGGEIIYPVDGIGGSYQGDALGTMETNSFTHGTQDVVSTHRQFNDGCILPQLIEVRCGQAACDEDVADQGASSYLRNTLEIDDMLNLFALGMLGKGSFNSSNKILVWCNEFNGKHAWPSIMIVYSIPRLCALCMASNN